MSSEILIISYLTIKSYILRGKHLNLSLRVDYLDLEEEERQNG